jgi:uncharacterized membrane protein YkoI
LVAGVAAFVAVAVGTGAVVAKQADDAEAPITGPALDQASEAALAFTGEGRVTETEVGDEDSYYEVEVTLTDGSQVDVQLDRDFNVVDSKADARDDEGGDSDD